jgi:Ca2+-transporting ATPase
MKTISLESLSGLQQQDGGLSISEVKAQGLRFGTNDIVEVAGNPWLELFRDTAKDPMIWFLIGIGSVFFLTGEVADGITLFLAVFPLLFMDAFLHWRTRASTALLKGQMSSRIKVRRASRDC